MTINLAPLSLAALAMLSSCAGGPDAQPNQGTELPVSIIRGEPDRTDWLDLTFDGHGFTAHEGRLVTIRVGTPDNPPARLASARVRIRGGAFMVAFPKVDLPAMYTRRLLFVDVDGDGVCAAEADRVFAQFVALYENQVLTVADGPFAAGEVAMLPSFDPTVDCQALNAPWPET